jgi:hypothetical protein
MPGRRPGLRAAVADWGPTRCLNSSVTSDSRELFDPEKTSADDHKMLSIPEMVLR